MSAKTLNVVIDIDAPPQQVFAVLCDVERWPQWTPTMSSVQRLDQGAFAVGSSVRVHQPKLRATVWKVTEIQPQRNFTWVTRSPGLRMQAGHLVEPSGSGSGSRVSLTFEISGILAGLVARMYGALIEEYVRTESQKLKQHCEI
jgi:uncharacterized membrane protein